MQMQEAQLFQIRDQLKQICADTAIFISDQLDRVRNEDIEHKELNSLVSYVDKEAEVKLVHALKSILPDAGFITEENTVSSDFREYMWVIDPLDGTSNFLYKIPHFSISIALLQGEEILLGIVYDIMRKNAYSAIRNNGAWMDETPIRVSKNLLPGEAMVATGFPYSRELSLDQRLQVFRYCILNYRGVRRFGSAALDLAFVAAGKFDAYYENTLSIWDIAAGILLVREAGGLVTDYRNEDSCLQSGEVVAGTQIIHSDLIIQVQNHLS